MKKIRVCIVIFPSIVMSLITMLSCSLMTKNFYFDWKGIFIISIVLVFPLLFLIQGVASVLSKTNVFLSFGVSVLTFLMLMIIYLNGSSLIGILIYLIVGFIGYGIGYGLEKKV